jgi:uncharacterized protein YybS (DUF2232 family)
MASIFTWIVAPPPFFPAVPEASRLLGGSCLGAIMLTYVFFQAASSPGFSEYIGSLLASLISAYRSSGADVVGAAMIEGLTAEAALESIKAILLRGGSLVSSVFLFTVCRQISLFSARLSLRQGRAALTGINNLAAFHVNPVIIWIFSASLLSVVLTRMTKLLIPEIILWNILILCVILYLAQGLGILQFFLARPSMSPFLRLLFGILLVVMLFSPILNVILFASLLLLGIAENWAPLRAPKNNGPPSTPEAGG